MNHYLIEISDEDRALLEGLATTSLAVLPLAEGSDPVVEVLEYAARCIAAGVRRPGSWEAAAVAAMFGGTASMIWLIEEQLAYALGASAGDELVMRQAEAMARWRYIACTVLLPMWGDYWLFQKI